MKETEVNFCKAHQVKLSPLSLDVLKNFKNMYPWELLVNIAANK